MQRLDLVLVDRGLVASRSRARDLIVRGHVTVDGTPVTKPAAGVPSGAVLTVTPEAADVSRGAVKLRAALDAFGFDAGGRVALDIGASTGGFTQVLLDRGALKVYAVDVGSGQLASDLRADARVVSLENLDARDLSSSHVGQQVGAIVADVSFISLTKALPVPLGLAAPGAWLVALVKPQFEVGREGVGKGGIVADPTLRERAAAHIKDWLAGNAGWQIMGLVPSPITGGSGNVEFLLGARFDG